jgi:hypothetical protein
MRPVAAVALVAFIAIAGGAPAKGNDPYSSPEGKFKVRFPGTPKVATKTTKTDLGELAVTVATFATSDGHVYMVSYTDFPAAPKPENRAMLFAGVRDGIKSDGKQVGADKVLEFGPDKLPEREFVVDKGKQRIRVRAVLRDARMYQIAAIGSVDFAGGKDASLFLESFELTN